jgi:hypothetical protein
MAVRPPRSITYGLLAIALTLVLAGCGAGGSSSATTLAPDSLSDDDAQREVLNAEKFFLRDALSSKECVRDTGTDTAMSSNVTVKNRTANSVYVLVTQPYWYRTEGKMSNGESSALYAVNPNETRRVRGDEPAPCE